MSWEPIGWLKPHPKNAKQHPPAQIEALAKHIQKFGFTQPIEAERDGTIIVGHGRLESAKRLGLTEVPVVIRELSQTDARIRRVFDNAIAETSWDKDLLRTEVGELLEFASLNEIGILPDSDAMELVADLGGNETKTEGLTDPDAVPDVGDATESRCNLGDVWQLGRHRLMCGDSTKAEDVARLMGKDQADVCFTDPPYNVAYEGQNGMTIQNDSMSDGDFLSFLTAAMSGLSSVLRPGAAFYIAHADLEGFNFRASVKAAGLQIRQCCIWVKPSLVMGRQDYHWRHEPILYGWKEGAAHTWNTDRKQTTVWEFAKPHSSQLHPTMKPVELVEYALGNSAKAGSVVYEPFAGSGTTLIAAERLGMSARAMELDPRYASVIIKRWEDFTGETAALVP